MVEVTIVGLLKELGAILRSLVIDDLTYKRSVACG